ncbi:hypothetical protein EJ110_NYTH22848 [Nymphaea thermarum]|nr:hypothetical protein EJ110_NYTH22848 [Nymphaea thermarum]
MAEYLNHVKFLNDSLAAVGNHVTETDIVLFTLNGLSSDYEAFITSVTTSKNLPSFSEIYDLLIAQEQRLCMFSSLTHVQVEANTSVFMAQRGRGRGRFGGQVNNPRGRGRNSGRGSGRVNSMQGVTCQYCGRKNHTARQCFDIPKAFMAMMLTANKNDDNKGSSSTLSDANADWYPDTGATHHVTNSDHQLQDPPNVDPKCNHH